MKRILFILLVLARTGYSQTAIVDVNVIPMDREVVLDHQTVIIDKGVITDIGPASKVKVPRTAVVVDGKGKYLIPGLADMHVHVTKRDLPIFLANGVTLVRNLNGDTSHLSMRKNIAEGRLIGPTLLTSGPLIGGPEIRWKLKVVPKSADDVRRIVQEQKKMGYDVIKLYDGLTKEIFDAAMDQAKADGMMTAGHVPATVGLDGVLEKKMNSIEHVEKIVYASFGWSFDVGKIPEVARQVKDAGTWVTPTLAVQEIFYLNSQGSFLTMLDNPEMAYADPGNLGWWKSFASQKNSHQQSENGFYKFQIELTRGLFKAGVPLLAGTDCPNPGMVSGFSLHHELRNLTLAGLTPYQALVTATSNPALFLGKAKEFGTIKKGMRADLVLLEKNPLENIDNTRTILAVAVKGQWYSIQQLQSMIEMVKGKD